MRTAHSTVETRYSVLPPLKKLTIQSSTAVNGGRNEKLACVLREAARLAQKGSCQNFYSIRGVASHFDVPTATVTRVFEQLKAEGLITTAWGSKTVLQPARLNRKLDFRGVLAMLTPTELFAGDVTALRSFRTTWSTLWRAGFAARIWLYDSSEAESRSFVNEILSEKPDGIVWLMPHNRVTLLGHRLLDCGIRVTRLALAMTHVQMLQTITDTFG